MFDEKARILYGDETSGASFFRGGGIFYALLEPQKLCADFDGALGNRRHVFGATENVNQVNRFGNVFKGRA